MMTFNSKTIKEVSPIFLLIVIGGLFQLGIVLYFYIHFDFAIDRLMPDDAFYYFKIAENIRHGLGSVFSVNEPTNGYHPLWMILLVGIQFAFSPGKETFILYALFLAVCLNMGSAFILYYFLTGLGLRRQQVLLGITVFLWMPYMVHISLTGLETPLFHFLLLSVFAIVQKILKDSNDLSKKYIILLGICSGLLMLARTDSIFFTSFIYSYLLVKNYKKHVFPLFLSGVVATVVLSPWLLWNIATFGTIVQSSGVAMSGLYHWYMPSMITWEYFLKASTKALGSFYWLFGFLLRQQGNYYHGGSPAWKFCIGCILASIVAISLYKKTIKKNLILPVWIWGPSLLFLIFHLYVRLFVQVWHLSVALLIMVLFIVNLIDEKILSSVRLIGIIIILGSITIYTLQYCYFYPQQGIINVYKTYKANSIKPLKIGHTDCGYFGYFSKHTVVNLDGVVNNRALQYILAGRFSEYVAMQNFDEVLMDGRDYRLSYYDRNIK